MTFQERYQYDPKTNLLGKGGYFCIYKGRDMLLDREVAIKTFNINERKYYLGDQEMKMIFKLDHPNILRYFDVMVIEQTTILEKKELFQIETMEFSSMGNIKQFAEKNPNSPILPVLLKQVLHGLLYLHGKGIVHRNLKPSNILIFESNREITAKIGGFGINENMNNYIYGSKMEAINTNYMAPEQFNPVKYGINGKIGYNVDLWSFGMIMYELLTTVPVLEKKENFETIEQILSFVLPTNIPIGIDDLSEPYKTIVEFCLIKNATERVQAADNLIYLLELEDDIKKLKNEDFQILPDSPNIRRNKVLFLAALILIFLVGSFTYINQTSMETSLEAEPDSLAENPTDTISNSIKKDSFNFSNFSKVLNNTKSSKNKKIDSISKTKKP